MLLAISMRIWVYTTVIASLHKILISRCSFHRGTQLFVSLNRSHGERGADVETLRGTTGANYEGEAKVSRGGSSNGLCGCLGGSSGEPVSF